MLPFTILGLSLALAVPNALAMPTRMVPLASALVERRQLSPDVVSALTNGDCDLSAATMPAAPTALPPPRAGLVLHHVAVGRGTQNYTCSSASATETPTAVGAKAELFNVTCAAVRAPAALAALPSIALQHAMPTSSAAAQLRSGEHFFADTTTAVFDLDTTAHEYGAAKAKKNATSNAPVVQAASANATAGNVAWLKLEAISGDIEDIYRVNTAGGSPPQNCSGKSGEFEVPYSAVYYFWSRHASGLG